MTIGGSIFLIAVGAIFRYAVETEIAGIDIDVVGVILMIAGIAGLLIGLVMYFNETRGGTNQNPPPDQRQR